MLLDDLKIYKIVIVAHSMGGYIMSYYSINNK